MLEVLDHAASKILVKKDKIILLSQDTLLSMSRAFPGTPDLLNSMDEEENDDGSQYNASSEKTISVR